MREDAIRQWMLSTAFGPGLDRYDDLHIDQVDARWKLKKTWVDGGFEAFNIGLKCRTMHEIRFSLILAFSLIADQDRIGLNFASRPDFERNLSRTPPSLYLLRPGEEFWTQTRAPNISDVAVRTFSPSLIGKDLKDVICHFMEFKRISVGEFTRSVFVHKE